jgi:arylsulfatase A-like enzyme
MDRGFGECLYNGGGGVGQTPDSWGNKYQDDTYFHNGVPEPQHGYCTDVWFDHALQFVEANKDRPFFVYLATNVVHEPIIPPPGLAELYSDQPPGLAAYFRMIANLDQNIGRFRRQLTEMGLADNTILIYTSDNGATGRFAKVYNAGMRGTKGTYYEGGHREPGFIHWPKGGMTGGRDVNQLCSFTDVLPTLIDLCELKLPVAAHFDGVNLTPARGHPNIVYILCDDLGYGDVHALNPERGKIATPNIDRLISQGMVFTDAHAGSSVCTPSRYGILTGRYCWRTKLQASVLSGTSDPLIASDRLTVGALLKQHGYATACLGKWHLGLKFGPSKWADPIEDGPLQHGFDYFFGISASLDMPPFAYIENSRLTQEPTVEKKWVRSGPAAKDFDAMNVVPDLAKKAAEYIAAHANDSKAGKPFFMYLALTSPHTPLVPTPAWQGKSSLGPYGDFVMETDWAAGEVLKALDEAGIADHTLVMFTSDNGCAPYIGVHELEAKGHYPSAEFRGYKSDIWDGGHRIPFIARWPARVKAGSKSDQLVCLTDLMATCADMLGEKLPDTAAEDSVSILPALLAQDKAGLREAVVHHSIFGLFAIRQGNWKLELCPGSGGWSAPKEAAARKKGLPSIQLYDMANDVSETHNVESANPLVVERLTRLLEKYVADGRSTPGMRQKNDSEIDLWKKPHPGTTKSTTVGD